MYQSIIISFIILNILNFNLLFHFYLVSTFNQYTYNYMKK